MSRNDLLDEGENRALRTFLMQYGLPGLTVGAMRDHMRRSGWDSCWPEWVTTSSKDSHLTKAGAQLWIRHLISLEPVAEQSPQAPCGESIDTPEFKALLRSWWDADSTEVSSARAALIAHIDAKITAARRDGLPGGMQDMQKLLAGEIKDAERWRAWLPWMRGLNKKPFNLAKEISQIDSATPSPDKG